MLDVVYGLLWASGMVLFILHNFPEKRGGVMSSGAMTLMWAALSYASTNVIVASSGVLITTSNPMAMWISIAMAFGSSIILFFSLFGEWGSAEGEATDEPDPMSSHVSERL